MEKRIIWKKQHEDRTFFSADMKNWIDNPRIWFDDFDECQIKNYPDDSCAK